jgi:(2Fe-2S) ferredoxin
MTATTKRIVLCRGQFCNMDRRADKLYAALEPLLEALNGEAYPPLVRLTTANCLSMCGAGPNCIIYPDNIALNQLTVDKLPQLVKEYLSHGD